MKMEQKDSSNEEELPFYVSKDIVKQLHKAKKKVLESDQDRIYVITGREGLGKSTLAMQLGYVVDKTLTLDDVVFTSTQFANRIRQVHQGKAIIFDESFHGLSSKGAISRENKKLVMLLQECRQRNLFIFIVMPSFFLLEKYVALFRSTALFNVLASRKNFKLRYYKVYNYADKKILYILGKNLMDYSRPKITKSHKFYRKLPLSIDDTAYRSKKLSAFRGRETEEREESGFIRQRNCILHYLYDQHGLSYVEIAEVLESYGNGMDVSGIGRIIRDVTKKTGKGKRKL